MAQGVNNNQPDLDPEALGEPTPEATPSIPTVPNLNRRPGSPEDKKKPDEPSANLERQDPALNVSGSRGGELRGTERSGASTAETSPKGSKDSASSPGELSTSRQTTKTPGGGGGTVSKKGGKDLASHVPSTGKKNQPGGDSREQKSGANVGKKIEAAKDTATLGASVADQNYVEAVKKFGEMAKKAVTDEEYRKEFLKAIIQIIVILAMPIGCCFGCFMAVAVVIVGVLFGTVQHDYYQQRNLYKSCPTATFTSDYIAIKDYGDNLPGAPCTGVSELWNEYKLAAQSADPEVDWRLIASIDQAGYGGDPGQRNYIASGRSSERLQDCNADCEPLPCVDSSGNDISANQSCPAPICERDRCYNKCATNNRLVMTTRVNWIATKIRNIFKAERLIATSKAGDEADKGTDLPVFDSWKGDDVIGDSRFNIMCRLLYDYKNYPDKSFDQCTKDPWIVGFLDQDMSNLESEELPCPDGCGVPQSTLGALTSYKYMIGYLQTDRCKNCHNPFWSKVCNENGVNVDLNANPNDTCTDVPPNSCACCNCPDCPSTCPVGGAAASGFYYPYSLDGLESVPLELRDPFQKAAARYRISPLFLASVFSGGEHGGKWPSSGPWAVGSSGDTGPFQFLECTWEGWNQPLCKSSFGKANGVFETNQKIIDSIGGYGQDGDSDNVADVNNIYDAAFAAADYLARAGATNNGVPVTDQDKLHDAAAKYNGGSYWKSPMAQNYADRAMKVYNRLSL